jgi:hypothetical protein
MQENADVSDQASIATRWIGLIIPALFLVETVLLAGRQWMDWGEETFDVFRLLFMAQDGPLAMVWCVLVVVAWVLSGKVDDLRPWLTGVDKYRVWLIVGSLFVYCIVSLVVFRAHPLTMDEFSVLFQARIFASGHMQGHFPPDVADVLIFPGYLDYFVVVDPRSGGVIESYWPGFSLILAPFVWLGVPWLCTPVLATLTLVVARRVTHRLMSSSSANGAVLLLFAASGAHVVMGGTYYSMTAHLLLNLLFADLLLTDRPLATLGAGLVGGFALVLHNPFPHTMFALPWLVYLLFSRRFGKLAVLLGAYLPLLIGVLWGWSQLRSQMSVAPPVFHGDFWGYLAIFRLPSMDVLAWRLVGTLKLFVWLLPFTVPLALYQWYRSKSVGVRLLMASALVTYISYFVVNFSQTHGWGYRYMHPAIGAIMVVAACFFADSTHRGARRLAGVLVVTAVMSVAIVIPLQLGSTAWFVDSHLSQVPRFDDGKYRVVFVNADLGYYSADLVQNMPFVDANTTYLCSRSDAFEKRWIEDFVENAELETRYPLGSIWTLERPFLDSLIDNKDR